MRQSLGKRQRWSLQFEWVRKRLGRLWNLTLYILNERERLKPVFFSEPMSFYPDLHEYAPFTAKACRKDWNLMAFQAFLGFLESLFSSWSASSWLAMAGVFWREGLAMIRNSMPAGRHDEIDILWKDLCCFHGTHFCFWMVCIYPFPWRWEQIMKFFEMLSSEHRGSSPTVCLPRQRKKCYVERC